MHVYVSAGIMAAVKGFQNELIKNAVVVYRGGYL